MINLLKRTPIPMYVFFIVVSILGITVLTILDIYRINRDIEIPLKSCEEFWNEPCQFAAVPKSIYSNFDPAYYKSVKEGMEELKKENQQ